VPKARSSGKSFANKLKNREENFVPQPLPVEKFRPPTKDCFSLSISGIKKKYHLKRH
jgi:hypothetical protein